MTGMSISTEHLKLNTPNEVLLFDRFGDDHDRFSFPGHVYRVTGGHGGEAILILGRGNNVLIDCGMAYSAHITIENIKKVLADEAVIKDSRCRQGKLDYILLSHSHYDHMGALPYILEEFPEAKVLAGAHCAKVLEREGAKKLIKELGETARDLYDPGSRMEIIAEGIHVDEVLEEGSCLYIGEKGDEAEYIKAIETPGHTNCSMSFLIMPMGLLFSSESTGILEGEDYVHTPCLKSFIQGIASAEKCRAIDARHLCLPHFGMVPDSFIPEFWDMFIKECGSKTDFISRLENEGLSQDEILSRYVERYWTPIKEEEQPKEAFEINSGHIVKSLMNELDQLKNRFDIR